VLSERGIKIAPSIHYTRAKTPITLAELAEAYLAMVRLPPHTSRVRPPQRTPGRATGQHALGEQDHVTSPSQRLGRGNADHATAHDGDFEGWTRYESTIYCA
jgi:hypothetical protein